MSRNTVRHLAQIIITALSCLGLILLPVIVMLGSLDRNAGDQRNIAVSWVILLIIAVTSCACTSAGNPSSSS